LWTLDFPEVTGASAQLLSKGEPLRDGVVEDYAVAQLDLATGTSVRLACSWNLPAGQEAVISTAFYGTGGGAALKNVGGSFYDFTAERYRGTSTETLISPPDSWGGRAAADWATRLGTGARFDPEAERLITVARALDSIYGR
jgi:predicted dehydrogenase